mgnify:CR=1 FL=1
MGNQPNLQDPENIRLGLPNRDAAYLQFDHDLVKKYEKYRFETDVPADKLAVFIKQNPAQGWGLFNQALAVGINSIPDSPEEFRCFFAREELPHWADWQQLERASNAIWRPGNLTLIIAAQASMIATYIAPQASQSMDRTGEQMVRTEGRGIETATWFAQATKPGNMKPGKEGYKLSVRVRLIHAFVRINLAEVEWNYEALGLPLNQERNATAIAFTFSSVFIDAAKKIGTRYNKTEREDIFAFWRYMGFLLGAPEDLLMENEEQARTQCALMTLTDLPPDAQGQRLTKLFTEQTPNLDDALIKAASTSAAKFIKSGPAFHALKYAITRRMFGDKISDQLAIPRSTLWRVALTCSTPFLYIIDQSKKYLVSQNRAHKTATNRIDNILNTIKEKTGTSGKLIDNS